MANPSDAMPLRELNQSIIGFETQPLPNHQQNIEDTQNSTSPIEGCKCKVSSGLATPDRLKLPKPFKYPERYTSPTDNILSPISKGLLARKSRRGGALLPPSMVQTKIQELRSPNMQQNQMDLEQ